MSMSASFSRQGSRLAGLEGEVVLPGQERFDEARRAFNLAADQEPAAVVSAESARDVAAAVTFAAGQGQRIAAQGTGHNALPLGSLTGTILLKTERMRGIRIDPVAPPWAAFSGCRLSRISRPRSAASHSPSSRRSTSVIQARPTGCSRRCARSGPSTTRSRPSPRRSSCTCT